MRADEAVMLVNKAFNCNIDARGDLSHYNKIMKVLRLDMVFTKEELIQKLISYKIKELETYLRL